MRKYAISKANSIIVERLNECHLSDLDREVAMRALSNADTIVDGILWIAHKLEQVGHLFLSPSLKH